MLNNNKVKYNILSDPLSVIFAALADPTRRAILERLSSGPATVNELAQPFRFSLPAISRHLKVLEHAGLITRGRNAQWRPCKLEVAPLKQIAEWTNHYRQFWEGSFDGLEEYIDRLQHKETK